MINHYVTNVIQLYYYTLSDICETWSHTLPRRFNKSAPKRISADLSIVSRTFVNTVYFEKPREFPVVSRHNIFLSLSLLRLRLRNSRGSTKERETEKKHALHTL